MSKFEVGKHYATRSLCDHDCIYTVQVVARTTQTVTIEEHGERTRRKIFIDWNGNEAIRPHGSYSMSAIISADERSIALAQIKAAA